MKVTSLISTLLLGSCALARPLDERTLEERQSDTQKQLFVTTGVSGTVYPRLEVREMKDTKPNQYTLLIVALNRWMKQSQNDYNGYFKFASIHGVPRDRYNNVDQCANCANTDGYGVHDNVLFPTWHRVYLATFEQRFLNIVRNVASEYPDAQRPTMIAAANQMRWPFYDAAIRPQNGKPAFPLLMSDVTVTVNGPKGKMTITNPLFRFDIPDPSGFVYAHFTEWKRTFRYPNTNDPNAASQTQSVVNAFANMRQSLADQFYQMFSNCHDYLHFSNDQAGSSIPSCATSVEDIHNAIHNAIGGTGNQDTGLSGGHMTYLPISSYDPAFWLHHSNIDRIIAMWQRINPNSWITNQVAPTASWTIAQGDTVGASSPLTPFLKSTRANDYWTSNDVKDWTVFGYTYSDFTVTDGSASAINSRINGLYGPNANIVVAKRDAEPQILDTLESMGSGVTDTVKNVVDGVEGAIGDLINPLTAHNGSTFQYVANIFTPRYALNGSYNIFLFNDVPSSELTSTWIADPKMIGMMGVTSKPNMTDNPLIASGSIPLTRTLQDSINSSFLGGILSDLTEAVVVPYLTQKLQWRVQGPLGQNIDPGTIEGFVVSVFASSAAPHNDDELPQYSNFINLLDVTKSQSGGANNSEQVAPPTISIPALPVSLPSYSSY